MDCRDFPKVHGKIRGSILDIIPKKLEEKIPTNIIPFLDKTTQIDYTINVYDKVMTMHAEYDMNLQAFNEEILFKKIKFKLVQNNDDTEISIF